jgi:hypothetical protein
LCVVVVKLGACVCVCILRLVVMIMRNDSVRLTPLGEWVYVGVVSVLCVAMGYAILRAFAVVVIKLGQVLGIV